MRALILGRGRFQFLELIHPWNQRNTKLLRDGTPSLHSGELSAGATHTGIIVRMVVGPQSERWGSQLGVSDVLNRGVINSACGYV